MRALFVSSRGTALRRALPAALCAAGLCLWLSRTAPRGALTAALQTVRIGSIAAILSGWALVMVSVEVWGFLLVCRRHLVPQLGARDAAAIVCGKQLLAPFLSGMTKFVAPLTLWRRFHIPPLRTVGSTELISAAETAALTVLATLAFLIAGSRHSLIVAGALGAYWLFLLTAVGFRSIAQRSAFFARLLRLQLFAPLAHTTLRDAAMLLSLRAVYAVISMSCIWLILRELGVHLPVVQVPIFGALLLFSELLPISIGGYGGPQGVAVLILATDWQACTVAQALAASLVWTTGMLAVRCLVGVVALPRLLTLLHRAEDARG